MREKVLNICVPVLERIAVALQYNHSKFGCCSLTSQCKHRLPALVLLRLSPRTSCYSTTNLNIFVASAPRMATPRLAFSAGLGTVCSLFQSDRYLNSLIQSNSCTGLAGDDLERAPFPETLTEKSGEVGESEPGKSS